MIYHYLIIAVITPTFFDCDALMVTDQPDLSVVLLCYRSEKALIPHIEKLKAHLIELNIKWEIILVGNYESDSNDKTPEIVTDLAKKDSRYIAITKKKEGMMGWDMKSGLENTSGNIIAVTDGDGQFPLTDIGRVYKKLIDEDLDIAKTYRLKRNDGFYRFAISSGYNFIINTIFPKLSCHDVNSKPKIFKAEVLNQMQLISDDWFIDAEIMIQARRLNLKFGEIPTQFDKLNSRKSFVKPTAILEFMANIILFRLKEFRYTKK
jgi:glycosyltransferase involved in cell wall biosynthesis